MLINKIGLNLGDLPTWEGVIVEKQIIFLVFFVSKVKSILHSHIYFYF